MPVERATGSNWGRSSMRETSQGHQIQGLEADDGAEIPVRIYGQDGDKTPLLMLHGIQSHSGWFADSANFVASMGHPVYSFDRRGSGLSRESRGHVARFSILIDDARTVAAAALQRHGGERVHVLGHCFGANPAALLACRYPDMVASLILATPAIYSHVPIGPIRQMEVVLLGFLRAGHLIPFSQRPEDLADFEANRQMIRDDPLALCQVTVGFLLETLRALLRLRRELCRSTVPLFMALAERDRIVDNSKSAALFHRIPSANKKLTIYPNATHILEFSEEKEAFFRDLADWLAGGCNRSAQKA